MSTCRTPISVQFRSREVLPLQPMQADALPVGESARVSRVFGVIYVVFGTEEVGNLGSNRPLVQKFFSNVDGTGSHPFVTTSDLLFSGGGV